MQVGDFGVQDLHGNAVQYSALKGNVTVVVFIATQCPVSNAYNERMKALYRGLHAQGVKFVFLNANRTEPAADVARHAQEHGFPFPSIRTTPTWWRTASGPPRRPNRS